MLHCLNKLVYAAFNTGDMRRMTKENNINSKFN